MWSQGRIFTRTRSLWLEMSRVLPKMPTPPRTLPAFAIPRDTLAKYERRAVRPTRPSKVRLSDLPTRARFWQEVANQAFLARRATFSKPQSFIFEWKINAHELTKAVGLPVDHAPDNDRF